VFSQDHSTAGWEPTCAGWFTDDVPAAPDRKETSRVLSAVVVAARGRAAGNPCVLLLTLQACGNQGARAKSGMSRSTSSLQGAFPVCQQGTD
jgi:hypothetical protein